MDSNARSLLRAGSYPGVSLRLRAKVFLPAFPAVPTGPPTSVTAPIAHTPPAHRVCGPASQRRGAWSHEMRSLSARSLVPLRCSRWASSSLTAASAFVVPHWSHSPIKIARYRCVPTGSCLFLKGTGWELRFGLSEALSPPKPRSCWVPCAPWPCSHASLCSATKLAVLSAHSTMQGLSLQQTSFASAVARRVCCAGC